MMKDNKEQIGLDCISRFESLREDFAAASKRIGLDAELQHLDATKEKSFEDQDDKETEQVAAACFAEDIAHLGYRPM